MAWCRIARLGRIASALGGFAGLAGLSCGGGGGGGGAYAGAYPGAYPGADPAATPPGAAAPNSTHDEPPASSSPGCGRAPAKIGASVQHVSALGRDRAYTLVVPEGYAPRAPYPLVLVLHGSGGSGASARNQTDLEKVAAGRAIFVYPDAPGGWNLDAPASSNGDVALFDAILFTAHNTLCIDPRRVFVTGFSNGAYMANQLACKRGDRIRAVATHAGGGPYETSGGSYDASGNLVCPGKAVAALIVHGNSDGSVAPAEGQKSIDHWSYANRCSSGRTSTLAPPCVALQGCYQPVDVCRIPGLGHGLWNQAGKVTWSFFDALR